MAIVEASPAWRVTPSPASKGRDRHYVEGGMMRNHFDVPGTTIHAVVAAALDVVDAGKARTMRGGPCFWSSWVCRSCAALPTTKAAQAAQIRPSSRQRLQSRI
jgi:hypothetical protein